MDLRRLQALRQPPRTLPTEDRAGRELENRRPGFLIEPPQPPQPRQWFLLPPNLLQKLVGKYPLPTNFHPRLDVRGGGGLADGGDAGQQECQQEHAGGQRSRCQLSAPDGPGRRADGGEQPEHSNRAADRGGR